MMMRCLQAACRTEKRIMRNPGLCLFLAAGMLYSGSGHAQDLHFSQLYEAPLYQSPANTGFFNGYVRAIANYRSQWAAMNNAFQTIAISLDGGMFKSKKRPAFMGLGFTIFNDRAGAANLQQTTAMLNMTGLVKLGKKSAMSAGIAGGWTGVSADYSNLTYESQFNGNTLDPTLLSGENPYRPYNATDFSAGLAYEFNSTKKDADHDDVTSFKVSVGAFHLNRPVQDFGLGAAYKLPVRMTYAFTSLIDLEDTKWSVMPAFVYQTQGPFNELIIGSFLKYRMAIGTKVTGKKNWNAFRFGLFYRNKDALIPQLAFDLGDFSVGLSYDALMSSYRTAARGFQGFEVSLRYNDLASSLFESRKEFR